MIARVKSSKDLDQHRDSESRKEIMTKEKATKANRMQDQALYNSVEKRQKDSNFELQRQGTRWCYEKEMVP